jgi:hypothetical protein
MCIGIDPRDHAVYQARAVDDSPKASRHHRQDAGNAGQKENRRYSQLDDL